MKTLFSSLMFAFSALSMSSPSVAETVGLELPDVHAQIVPGWHRADGKLVSAVRISMQDGWKTYWRTPGDGGIPPRMDWSRSRNLDNLSALWPSPLVFFENGMTSYGYQDELLLPLVVTPRRDGKPVHLQGQLEIGVCKEICVPVALTVQGELADSGTTVVASIAAAMAEQPFSAREAQVSGITCRLSPASDGLTVSATIDMPHSGGREHAVIETGNPELWVHEAKVSRSGDRLTVSSTVMHGEGAPFFLQRSSVDITVIGTDYAVEIKGCSAG